MSDIIRSSRSGSRQYSDVSRRHRRVSYVCDFFHNRLISLEADLTLLRVARSIIHFSAVTSFGNHVEPVCMFNRRWFNHLSFTRVGRRHVLVLLMSLNNSARL